LDLQCSVVVHAVGAVLLLLSDWLLAAQHLHVLRQEELLVRGLGSNGVR
jgi:hypothetical protein